MTMLQTSTMQDRVEALLKRITKSTQGWRDGDDHARLDLITACSDIVREIEHASEALLRMFCETPSQTIAIETAIDLGLFAEVNAGEPKSTAQLAEAVNADPALLIRLLRVLTSVSAVKEVQKGHFGPTRLSKALAQPDFANMVKVEMNFLIPVYLQTPAYLREGKYQNPADPKDAPTQFLFGGKGELDLFQLLHRRDSMDNFMSLMRVWMNDHKHWSDEQAGFYPVQERLISGARTGKDEVFVVDIGGGQGIDFSKLLTLHPRDTLPGRLVLQDLPDTIDSIPPGALPESVELVKYDFFTPQPIKGKF